MLLIRRAACFAVLVGGFLGWATGEARAAEGDGGGSGFSVLRDLEGLVPAVGQQGEDEPQRISVTGRVLLEPGERQGRLEVMVQLAPNWHIYSLTQPSGGPLRSEIRLEPVEGVTVGTFQPDRPPVRRKLDVFTVPVEEHSGRVVWSAPIELAPSVDPEQLEVSGSIGGQICEENGVCIPLMSRQTAFVAKVQAPEAAGAGWLGEIQVDRSEYSLGQILLIAFLGGVILNVMPCVLPVIPLKVMSFVQQAGEDRGRILILNLWYAGGLIAVFMVLATLSAAATLGIGENNLGWGEQFTFEPFTITLTAIVFAMGLSFLGVWEVPIPGFAASSTAQSLANREGPVGAFSKGILATLLATPCTAPFMGTALAWSAAKPVHLVYLVFFTIGLGMGLPYLILGAFPSLIRLLPRPGRWMETVKQLMGFVLMGTVVFLLSTLGWENILPTVLVLLAISVAAWWVGRTPITAELPVRLRSWVGAALVIVVIATYAFSGPVVVGGMTLWGLRATMLARLAEDGARYAQVEAPYELPWQPFSTARLEELVADGRTVMVDFTADWCSNCKVLERVVLNTEPILEAVKRHQIVPLRADWSDRNPEFGALLEKLASKQIPVLAIFPADRPTRPIVLQGGYTRAQLLEALAKAAGQNEAEPSTDVALNQR